MKAKDSTALEEALRGSVVLLPDSLPCLWPQPVPCKNLGLLSLPDGTPVCSDHKNYYDRL